MKEAAGKKYIRIAPEISVTACAVATDEGALDILNELDFDDYSQKPNKFWGSSPPHERARLKVYKNEPEQLIIPMPFLGGWAELQLRGRRCIVRNGITIRLRPVLIGRRRSFDPRIGESGEWALETQPIQPKEICDKRTHYFLSLRIYHQDHKPEKPGDWHWEQVYIAIGGQEFFKIDVLWEKEEITITKTPLDPDSSEIPEHIKTNEAAQEELMSVLRRAR